MAEAIARVDAYDAIDAFSAGLAPIGFCHRVDQANPHKKRMLGGRPGVHEHLAQSLGAGRHRHQHEWPLREMAFDDYSRVEDWNIEDPMVRIPALISGSSRKFDCVLQNWLRNAGNNWLRNPGKGTPVRFTERRARGRKCPSSPILIDLDGGNNASVLNISEDDWPCQQPQFCPSSSSEYAGRVPGIFSSLGRSAARSLEKQFREKK